MATIPRDVLARQLTERRNRLRTVLENEDGEDHLVALLGQVDAALERLDGSSWGRCVVCNETIEERDLRVNPLLEYCLCALTPQQQRALEHDLNLARRIQAGLLPDPDPGVAGWNTHYLYEPAGVVSGDYCDLWTRPEDPDTIHFVVADVSGKGVAASLLMAHLQSAFRSLVGADVPLAELVARVNRQLLAANLPAHYATLAAGEASADGRVTMVNAGHCPPLLVRPSGVETLEPTGFPVGLLGDHPYRLTEVRLEKGESLVLYTDGLSEARNPGDDEYGAERVARALSGNPLPRADALVRHLRADLDRFRNGTALLDDLTVMALTRS